MLPSRLLDATQADLERLIADKWQEGPHLDYKRELPAAWDDKAKHRLMADVTAFANAGGGDIIYGMDETADAQAAALVPQVLSSVDEEVRRVQDFLLNLAEPRLPGTQVHGIPVTAAGVSGYALVIRVPESWAGPHRVKTNQHFFVRDGLRNRQLDVPEIRALFLRTESQAQRIRDFRSERLARVLTGETPCKLQPGPQFAVHAVPTQAALGLVQLDPVPYTRRSRSLPMLGRHSASSVTLNFDGAYGILPTREPATNAYTQLFRQGFFEAVWVLVPFGDSKLPVLPGIAYEQLTIQFLEQVRGELSASGVATDMAVFLSVLGADNVEFAGPSEFGGGWTPAHFDRRNVLLPDVLIPADVSVGRGMRPAFDLMCQSVGLDGSMNYGEDGEWKKA